MLVYLILTSGALSALLVNDTVCFMFTPLVVAVVVRGKLPLLPYLLALAMSANIGSVCTLVGNPQNMIIEGLNSTGLPDQIFAGLRGLFGSSASAQAWNFAWFSALGSNVFSNVPFVLVAGKWINSFGQPELMWKVMALATTFAGNLTILGSVANVIVVESARRHVEVSFGDYARFGIPVTVLTTVVGMAILLLLR